MITTYSKTFDGIRSGEKIRGYVIGGKPMLMAYDVARASNYAGTSSIRPLIDNKDEKCFYNLPDVPRNGSPTLLLDKKDLKIWFEYVRNRGHIKDSGGRAKGKETRRNFEEFIWNVFDEVARHAFKPSLPIEQEHPEEFSRLDRIEQKLDLIIAELGIKDKENHT